MERKKMTDQPRWWYFVEIIVVSLTSISALRGGFAWLLFVTVPLLVIFVGLLVLKSIRANSSFE